MEVLLFLVLVHAVVFAVFCASVAGIKRKNSIKGLGLGFLFGFVALLVLIGSLLASRGQTASGRSFRTDQATNRISKRHSQNDTPRRHSHKLRHRNDDGVYNSSKTS